MLLTDCSSVERIMTKNLILLNINDDLAKAETLFKKNNITHLPVVNKNEVVGILSLRDLHRISFADSFGETERKIDDEVYKLFSLDQVMVSNVVCVDAHDNINDVAKIFLEKKFHALPVTENNKLVGIVTTTDIIRHFLESK